MSHETNPENRCPHCHAKLDQATDTDGDAKPQPGDFSLCIRCGEMLKFTDGLRIEALADVEYQKLPQVTRNQLRIGQLILRAHRRTLGGVN